MIRTMEKAEHESQDKEEVTPPSIPTKQMAQVPSSTPTITSFFKTSTKPSPQNNDVKPTDLRNFFPVTSKKDQPKSSHRTGSEPEKKEQKTPKAGKTCQKGDEILGDSGEQKTPKGSEKKEKGGSKRGVAVQSSKKRKKEKNDGERSSGEDFESPPPTRRKRKSRLDTESIQDLVEAESSKPTPDIDKEDSSSEDDPGFCNGKMSDEMMNGSTVVSYEDFLNASMEDGDEQEEGAGNGDDAINCGQDMSEKMETRIPLKNKGVLQETLENVLLTPPDSRCSQKMSDAEQTLTKDTTSQKEPNGKDAGKDVKGATKPQLSEKDEKDPAEKQLPPVDADEEEHPPRKMLTIKAQVHSPFDGKDKEISGKIRKRVASSPSTSPVTSSSESAHKEGKILPRRLLTNVCVPDSSPELTTISVLEKKEEVKKNVGPVYSIFQKKPAGMKKEARHEEKTEPTKDATQDDSGKKIDAKGIATDGRVPSTKEQNGEVEEEKREEKVGKGKQGVTRREEECNSNQHSKKPKTKMVKTAEEAASVKETKKPQNTKLGKGSKNPNVKRALLKDKQEEKTEKPTSSEGSLEVTKRVLRTRIAKQPDKDVADLDASIDEFEDAKPLNAKSISARKRSQRDEKTKAKPTVNETAQSKVKGKLSPKKGTKDKSCQPAKTSRLTNGTPKKFKASLVTGAKGQGPIKLKLTAIKASPKKNTKVAKAQQLLQKAKKGNHVTMATKSQPQLLTTKKMNQTKLGPKGVSIMASKNEKSSLGKGKGEAEAKTIGKGKLNGVVKKGVAGKEMTGRKINGAIKLTSPGNRRRSSSRLKPKTPPKPAAKLAPIFTKQGQMAAAKKFRQDSLLSAMATTDGILPLDESSRDSLSCSRDGFASGDPASMAIPSFGFNMLEQLKAGSETAMKEGPQFMPFPVVSHVLQKDEELNWNLPHPVFSKWKLGPSPDINRTLLDKPIIPVQPGDLTDSKDDRKGSFSFESFAGHPPLSEADQKSVIEDVLRASEKFPASRVFKIYQAKKSGEKVKKKDEITPPEKTAEPNVDNARVKKEMKPQRGKRKAEEVAAEEEEDAGGSRRKMARTEGRRKSTRCSLDLDGGTGGESTAGEGEEEETGKRSLRRSSRRQSRRLEFKEEEEEKKEEKGPKDGAKGDGKNEEEKMKSEDKVSNVAEDQAARRRAGMQWTEKYQPTAASQMIGNTAVCKKFNSWLTDWKKKTQRMKEKTIRGQRKQTKSKGSKKGESDDDDSDDDFFCSDDDDSDEEDGLCNTCLLVGPHGVGKTSLVYACAQELGFEVFEVNPSSRRSGRQILSELGEVTQSHQVVRQPGVSPANFFKPSPTKMATKNASPKKKKPAIPKAFAAFFKAGGADKKGSKNSKRSPMKKPRSPKKQVKKPTQAAAGKPFAGFLANTTKKSDSNTPKITSTSLILFDEVDVVFEEDKGFLAAITSFMETTKRPIVLTTSDPRFTYTLPGRFDELALKLPPLTSLTSHLQLICLAENVPTSHQGMKQIVQLLGRDVRRCLQHLQFWVLSGAMPQQSCQEVKTKCRCVVSQGEMDSHISEESAMDITELNAADGQMQKNVCSGTSVDLQTPCAVSCNKHLDSQKGLNDFKNRTDNSRPKCAFGDVQESETRVRGTDGKLVTTGSCAVHRGMLESIAGLGNVMGPVTDVLHLLKHFDSLGMDSRTKAAVLDAFHKLCLDISHHNLPHILNLCKATHDNSSSDSPTKQESSSVKMKNKQDNALELSRSKQESNSGKAENKHEEMESSDPTESQAKEMQEKMASRLGANLIHTLADHADIMSALDVQLPHGRRQRALLGRYGNQEWWQPLLFPALDDSEDSVSADFELVDVLPHDDRCESVVAEVNAWMEASSLTKCMRSFKKTLDAVRNSRADDVDFSKVLERVLPPTGDGSLCLQQSNPGTNIRDTHRLVVSKLPDNQYCNHPALALDYLPTLRGICRSEELRREANLKRRFFHYLDSIAMCLKPATFLSLASMLNQDHRPL